MKWKAKDDTCGVPGKGYIKAEDFSQEDENALIQRAKRRGLDVTQFMLGAGFVPAKGPQLEIEMEEVETAKAEEGSEETVTVPAGEANTASVEVSEEIKAEYKALHGRNPRSDMSLESVLAKIQEKKAEAPNGD